MSLDLPQLTEILPCRLGLLTLPPIRVIFVTFSTILFKLLKIAPHRFLPIAIALQKSKAISFCRGLFSVRSLAFGNFWMLGTFPPPVALPLCFGAMPAACRGCSFRRGCPLPLGSPPAPLLRSPPLPRAQPKKCICSRRGEMGKGSARPPGGGRGMRGASSRRRLCLRSFLAGGRAKR